MSKDWSAFALIMVEGDERQTVCVRSHSGNGHNFIRLVGGRMDQTDNDGVDTVLRWIRILTGMCIGRNQVSEVIGKKREEIVRKRGSRTETHTYPVILYRVIIRIDQLLDRKKAAPQTDICTEALATIANSKDFLHSHQQMLVKAKVLPKTEDE